MIYLCRLSCEKIWNFPLFEFKCWTFYLEILIAPDETLSRQTTLSRQFFQIFFGAITFHLVYSFCAESVTFLFLENETFWERRRDTSISHSLINRNADCSLMNNSVNIIDCLDIIEGFKFFDNPVYSPISIQSIIWRKSTVYVVPTLPVAQLEYRIEPLGRYD